MSLVWRILLGLALAALGSSMVIRTLWFKNFLGYVDWAERHLGGGGTNLLIKFIGIIFAFVGILVATGLWGSFLEATLGSIFPRQAL